MLPDVASEALAILRDDPILKKRFSVRERVLAETIDRVKAKNNVTTELVEQLRAHRRVLSTLGAATIFLPGTGVQVASEVVAVEAEPGTLRAFAVQERLPEE
jgi:hypothetical protein